MTTTTVGGQWVSCRPLPYCLSSWSPHAWDRFRLKRPSDAVEALLKRPRIGKAEATGIFPRYRSLWLLLGWSYAILAYFCSLRRFVLRTNKSGRDPCSHLPTQQPHHRQSTFKSNRDWQWMQLPSSQKIVWPHPNQKIHACTGLFISNGIAYWNRKT